MNTGSYETALPHHTQVQSINPLKGQKLLQLPAVAGRCGVSSPGYLFQHSRTHAHTQSMGPDPGPQVQSGIRDGSVEMRDLYLPYLWKISQHAPQDGEGGEGRGPGNAVAGGCPSQVAVSWLLPWRLSASPSCPRRRGRREWLRVCF